MARHLTYLKQEDGGLGVPHLERYFQAAQLRYMLEWYKLESEKNWCFINRSIVGMHIWKVPWLPRWHQPSGVYVSPLLRSTLGVWDRVQESCGLSTPMSSLTPFIGNPDFPPASVGNGYLHWQEANCKRIGDLFDEKGVLEFASLTAGFGIPQKAYWQYLALCHWVTQPQVRPHAGHPRQSLSCGILQGPPINAYYLTFIPS